MQIVPLGESALIVRLRDEFDEAPGQVLAEVRDAQRRLNAAAIPGVIECAPGYASVAVFFDAAQVMRNATAPAHALNGLTSQIVSALDGPPKQDSTTAEAISHEIPVCYEAEFAPDLALVSRHASLSAGEVVRRHCSGEYRVHCIGFMPGFPYLGGLPAELATPRRASPRTHVPAGSVGIGGAQTGIYPVASPGGWNVIGRTPVSLFDPTREQPALLRAGDRVRFRAITVEEFHAFPSENADA